MDINERIAERIKSLRLARGMSLAALAEQSGVSKSNISLIERGESSATAMVLDRLAAALGVTVASLFEAPKVPPNPEPLSHRDQQITWQDPASGYVRRNLSPALPSPLQLVEVHFPPKQRVAYETATRQSETWQQIWLLEGVMEMTVGETSWRLVEGDCFSMRLDQPTTFYNPGKHAARYLVALVSLPWYAQGE